MKKKQEGDDENDSFRTNYLEFLLGLVVGSRIRNDAEVNIGLTSGAIVLLFIVSIIMAWKLGTSLIIMISQ